MSAFGPFYPPPLQAAVNHAERLARWLQGEEDHRAPAGADADPWWIGRADEVEAVVDLVVLAWRHRLRTTDESVSTLDAYLAELHEGLGRRAGAIRPACCAAPCPTCVAPSCDAVTASGCDSIDMLLANLVCPLEGT